MEQYEWKIGFVGLGNIGGAIAESILGGKYQMVVYDINPQAVAHLEKFGANGAANPADLTEKSNLIFTSLPNTNAVKTVFLGENGILSSIKSGSIVVELSTIDPDTIRALDRLVSERGATLLDVTVSGSPAEARLGQLKLITSGDKTALEKIEPVLRRIGESVGHVGVSGDAKTVKLVNNLMTMGNVLVAAEAFTIGVKAGIDPDLLFQVLNQSGGRSHHFGKRFPNALARDFRPGFTVDLGAKDVGLALELSKSLNVPAPVSSLVYQLYNIVMSEGMSREDIVAIVKLYEKWGNVLVKGAAAEKEAE